MSVEGTPPAPQPAVSRGLSDPPVGSPSPVAATIPLTVPEYQRLIALEASFAQVKAEQQAALEAKEADKARLLAEKGQVEEGLKLATSQWEAKFRDATKKYEDLETSLLSERLDASLASSFAGRQFAGETPESQSVAASQLRLILKPQFESFRDASGAIVVRDKASLRPAAEVVKEALASPMYAHFFAPTSRGGTGSDGSRPPATQQETKPGTLEDIAAKYRAVRGGSGFGMFGVGK